MRELSSLRLKEVAEGKVIILVPDEPMPTRSVFYNPEMELSRDIAVCCLKAYRDLRGRHDLAVAEPLAATGVRGIRYAKEVEGVRLVLLGDVNPLAVELARRNVELNNLADRVLVSHVEAGRLLASRSEPSARLDVVDIDPFGSPAPFTEPSLKALRDGGLLMLTATDAPPLCGIYPSVAERRYGARSLNVEYCHELALRLILAHVATTALKLDMSIHPLLSYAFNHHYRVCVEVEVGASKAEECLEKLGSLIHCHSCGHRELISHRRLGQEPCPICGSETSTASPIWRGGLLDYEFTLRVLGEVEQSGFKHRRREATLLAKLLEEADSPPLYYTVDEACRRLKVSQPNIASVIEALRQWGFKATRTHFHSKGVKTDAYIMDVLAAVRKLAKKGSSHKGG